MEKNNKINLNQNFVRIIKGSGASFIISLVLLLIYAILLTYTNIPESTMTTVIITISGISILIGSTIGSLKIKKQGMLNGLLIGLIYALGMYLISSILLTGFMIDAKSIIMIIVCMITGMIGGIIGVNL